ncbi:hypothetical protein FGO68_gene2296 [Halteria grandinella]|uniref:Uncharacterized protein n=1 Tax=Halteria grandinella TaxID=5974 RepID=A0A8J8T3M3_HALGN|nr:hypothetical protein FGO68_gene2296 [Halteria grandinella]
MEIRANLSAQSPQVVEGYLFTHPDYQQIGLLLQELSHNIELQFQQLKRLGVPLYFSNSLLKLAEQLEGQLLKGRSYYGVELDPGKLGKLNEVEQMRISVCQSSKSNLASNKDISNYDQSSAQDSYKQQEGKSIKTSKLLIISKEINKRMTENRRMYVDTQSDFQRSIQSKLQQEEEDKLLLEDLLKQQRLKENIKHASSKYQQKTNLPQKPFDMPNLKPIVNAPVTKVQILPYKQSVEVGPIYNLKYDGWLSIQLMMGNLLEQRVDCIVYTANSYLSLARGLGGKIAKYGGKQVNEQC